MMMDRRSMMARPRKHKSIQRHLARGATVFVGVMALPAYLFLLLGRAPIGCGTVRIWSHRGHLDSSAPESLEWSCDYVLMELQKEGIRHFDVDLLWYDDESIVAHPMEMGGDLLSSSFKPSPCSRLLLKTFIQKLKLYYPQDEFFITMEPKSSWTEKEGDFLSPPDQVVGGILDVLDQEPIPHHHCGIILQPWQLEDIRIAPLRDRIKQHCLVTIPMRRDVGPLTENYLPDDYELIMPTIELFGDADGEWFLRESQKRGLDVVLWVIDTIASLRASLRMQGVHGAVSNHPIRLKRIYEQLCGSYNVKITVD